MLLQCPSGLVLNVLRSPEAHPSREWLDKPYVTCNHFDVDALTSVWAYLYRELALQYSEGNDTVLLTVPSSSSTRNIP